MRRAPKSSSYYHFHFDSSFGLNNMNRKLRGKTKFASASTSNHSITNPKTIPIIAIIHHLHMEACILRDEPFEIAILTNRISCFVYEFDIV